MLTRGDGNFERTQPSESSLADKTSRELSALTKVTAPARRRVFAQNQGGRGLEVLAKENIAGNSQGWFCNSGNDRRAFSGSGKTGGLNGSNRGITLGRRLEIGRCRTESSGQLQRRLSQLACDRIGICNLHLKW